MPAESTIFPSEPQSFVENEFGNEWEPVIPENESAAHELPHNESVQEVFLSPIQSDLLAFKGGFPEDWENVGSGEGFTLSNGAVRNNETGEAWPGFAEGTIEELDVKGLVRLDAVVVDGKEIVTYLIKGEGNSVRYEMHATDIRESLEEIDLHFERYKPLAAYEMGPSPTADPEASEVPRVNESEQLFDIAAAREAENTRQETEVELVASDAVQSDSIAEPVREYSYADVLESLEHLAVYRFEDESEVEISAPPAEYEADEVVTVAPPSMGPSMTAPRPEATHTEDPKPIESQESTTETGEPEKPQETYAPRPRATEMAPAVTPAETILVSPTLETPVAEPAAPEISTDDAQIQEAVRELLRDETPLENFFTDSANEDAATAVPADLAPSLSIRSIVATEQMTIGVPVALENDAPPQDRVTAKSPINESRNSEVREQYVPTEEISTETHERAVHENEAPPAQVSTAESTETSVVFAVVETLQSKRFTALTADDLTSTLTQKSTPANGNSRNGITIRIAA